MEPFPQDLIAQIATKLFRENGHSSGERMNTATGSPPGLRSENSATSIRDLLLSTPSATGFDAGTSLSNSSAPSSQSPHTLPNSLPYPSPIASTLPAHSNRIPHSTFSPNLSTSNLSTNLPANASSIPPSSVSPTRHASSDPHAANHVAPKTALEQNLKSTPSLFGSHGLQANEDGLKRFVLQVRGQPTASRDGCLGEPQTRMKPRYLGHDLPTTSNVKPFDVRSVREDFPILRQRIHGHPLAWLDNAATTQKPQVVIDAISRFYEFDNSNIHRGAHSLAARATDAYEGARQSTATFLGARSVKDIVFVRGTTEGINLVANAYGGKYLKKGDEILLSTVEHHANIVPWQMIAKRKGAVIRVIPINDRGEIIMDEYLRLLSPKTRIVSLTHASNSLGTILPVTEMTHMAKRYGARVLIDGAQSVSHIPINVQAMGCDFFVFSGHKIFGPTGIGALYVSEELHDVLPPWQGGGNMIKNVTFEKTTYSEAPAKFEAGTPNIADAVGLKAALDYVSQIGLSNISSHEHALTHNATEQLSRIPGLRIIGTAKEKVSVVSFVLEGRETEEIGKALDHAGIAVRSGHHCAQPSLRRFGLETTVRPSFSVYNTHEEVDRLVATVKQIAAKR